MLYLLGIAFLLGLVFNATPGAVFAETVRHALRGGFKPALAVQIGSLAGDAAWAVLGLAGAGVLLHVEGLRCPLGLTGVLYLLWLARQSWRSAQEARHWNVPPAPHGGALRSGVLLSLTNPQNLAFWAALGSAIGAIGVEQPQAADYLVFFAGFMAASVAWCFICAFVLAQAVKQLGPRWAAWTHRLCAAALLALACASARDLLRAPFGEPTFSVPALQGPGPWQP